jgi:hypothetical protein
MIEWSTFLSACAQALIFTLVVCLCVAAVRVTFGKDTSSLGEVVQRVKAGLAARRKDSGEAPQARVVAPTEKIPAAK